MCASPDDTCAMRSMMTASLSVEKEGTDCSQAVDVLRRQGASHWK